MTQPNEKFEFLSGASDIARNEPKGLGPELRLVDNFVVIEHRENSEEFSQVWLGSIEIPLTTGIIDDIPVSFFSLPPAEFLTDSEMHFVSASKIETVDFNHPAPEKCLRDINALVKLAREYEQAKKHSKAMSCIETILAVEPDNFEATFRKGRILEKLDKAEEAKKYSLKAYELEPGHFRPATTLGRIALREKRFDLAIYYFSKVTPEHDTYTEACTSIARALMSLDRTSESVSYLVTASKHRPEKLGYQRDVANALVKIGSFDEARAIYSKLSEHEDANVSRELAIVERALKRVDAPIPAIQFRGAFSADLDICVCCGPEERSVAFGRLCAELIAKQTGCRVDVWHSQQARAASWNTTGPSPNKQYEICFILPDAMLDPKFQSPTAHIKYSYLDEHRLEDVPDDIAESRYIDWLVLKAGI